MAKELIDVTGQRFGRYVAIKEIEPRQYPSGKKGRMYLCQCDCGNTREVAMNGLRQGNSRSCGCYQKEIAKHNTFKDLTGKVFGRLTVIKEGAGRVYDNGTQNATWICQCECGNTHETTTAILNSGKSNSCGCIQSMMMVERMSGKNHYNYNPNLTNEQRLKHRYVLGGKNAEKWRNDVYKRDNYTCQVCGARNGKGKRIDHNAHHLDGWNWCEEKRFDLDNGITLCKECHYDFHNTYGRGDNTKEQFEEHVEILAKGRLEWT